MAGINRPQDKQIIDPATGRIKLEWDAYFARLESLLNLAGAGGVTSFEGRTGIVISANGDYTASEVTNVPAGNIAATTVQAAINELDGEKAATSHTHAASDITSGTFDDARIAESNVTQHEGAIDHDALSGFVANEHVDHTAVALTAGAGLTGGGDISASRSFAVGAGTGITVNADDVAITAGGVGTTQLADEGVTLAKLEHAGAYTLLMRNAGTTGDPAYTKISALTDAGAFGSGDKLVIEESSGELRKIDYDDLPGGSGGASDIILLTSGTLASAASLDVVLTAYTAYRAIKFVFTEWVPQTDNVNLYCRTSTNGGSSYDSGGSDYAWAEFFLNATSGGAVGDGGDNLDSEIELGGAIGNAAGETFCAELTLFNQASSTGYKMICGTAAKISSSGTTSFSSLIGSRLAETDVDAIQFFFSSGNVSGKYAVYGVS